MKRTSILLLSLLLLPGCSPHAWWKSVNEKAAHLASVEARYQALQEEHEKLRQRHFRLESEFAALKAKMESRELASLNLSATGSLTGRRPDSVSYQPPRGLKPEELEALGFEHFRERRFAEAAITFDEFLNLPESATSTDEADAMFAAGVAWFQVRNFHKSRKLLEAARSSATGDQRDKIRRKADLWLRVIDRRLASEGQGGTE
jgi:hypothetical protein